MRPFFLFISIVCLSFLVGCQAPSVEESSENSQSDEDERRSEAANQHAAELKSQITAEIEALDRHAWAGSYYKGDGLGVSVSLMLAPAKGYLFEWHGCLGLYDRNYGNVTSAKERLQLSFTFPNERKGFRGIADEFVPVSWGDRKYLIPSEDIVGFCNEVNAGNEPRTSIYGLYLLREGDESKAATGSPEVPPEFRSYLLDRPIEAVIASIGEVNTRPSVCDWNFKETEVVIDAGTKSGILPGMDLHVTTPDDVIDEVLIQKVDERSSIGIITQFEDDATQIKAGWKLSTRPRWNP